MMARRPQILIDMIFFFFYFVFKVIIAVLSGNETTP